ncbi:MAG: phosphoribosylformylglycinamidine synthase subunit PurS [Firmicutes bacterium]|nr:phosphoribosylformylglycinamidine synthase subunit PurS [Bacillota bacterium]
MAQFRATVVVTLQPDVLDPAGDATAQVLRHMGYRVADVRIGKSIEVRLEAEDRAEAQALAHKMAASLLANPVMETFSVQVEEL